MATLITKNSSTAAAVPGTGDLVQGELAVNVTDKKLYTKDSGGSVVKVVGSLGNQEANAVAITGGTINGGSISNTSISLNSALTTNGSTGTSGQVLTSQGSGSPAQWTTPSTGNGLILLGTITPANGATTASITGLGAYESFVFITDNVTVSSNTALTFALSSNNGSSYGSGVGFTNGNGTTVSGQAQIFRTKTASTNKPYSTVNGVSPSAGSYSSVTGVVNAVQIGLNIVGPTFTGSGVVYVYGLGA